MEMYTLGILPPLFESQIACEQVQAFLPSSFQSFSSILPTILLYFLMFYACFLAPVWVVG